MLLLMLDLSAYQRIDRDHDHEHEHETDDLQKRPQRLHVLDVFLQLFAFRRFEHLREFFENGGRA